MKYWLFEKPSFAAEISVDDNSAVIENAFFKREIDFKKGTVSFFDKIKNVQIAGESEDFYFSCDNQRISPYKDMNFVDVEVKEAEKTKFGCDMPDGKTLTIKYSNDDFDAAIVFTVYSDLPCMMKKGSIVNKSGRFSTLNNYFVENLSFSDTASQYFYAETNYNGGSMLNNNRELSVKQNDKVLNVSFDDEINIDFNKGMTFDDLVVYELVHSAEYYEQRMIEVKEMYRRVLPWVNDAPLLYYAMTDSKKGVKKAIDDAANVGFDGVVQTFGSGINMENNSFLNIRKHKKLYDYAHSKGIKIGGYTLAIVKNYRPVRGKERNQYADKSGIMRCLATDWSEKYFKKILNFCVQTNADLIEIDGPYHFYKCLGGETHHHHGLHDSRYAQWKAATVDFFGDLKKNGVFINAPDWLFMSGSNKTGIGYEEIAFSQPRHEQLIASRIYNYKGTFGKLPSMAWSFVPINKYHGGGNAAYFAPLTKNFKDYEWTVFQHFVSGVIPCFRGKNIYDSPETMNMVKKWSDFYKKYRDVINGITVHFMPPRFDEKNHQRTSDLDAILNLYPQGDVRGVLAVFNQTDRKIKKTIKVPLYYSGLCGDCPMPAPKENAGIADVPVPVYGEYFPTFPVYEDEVGSSAKPVTGFGDSFNLKREKYPEVDAQPTENTATFVKEEKDAFTVTIDSNCDASIDIELDSMSYTYFIIKK